MNIFSQFLKQWSSNPDFDEFLAFWDRLESLVVRIYREKTQVAAEEREFTEVWTWLGHNYERWAADLRPFWQKTNVAGKPATTDPFQLLIDLESLAQISGDWNLMQHLPAAREALNQYLRTL